MTSRIENNVTYTQTWDAENRLTIVTSTVSAAKPVSRFTYDGDGNRVMQVQISGTQVMTTAYAGAIEVQITATQRITKTYYSAGSQLIAMRQYTTPTSSVLYFLHSDHLGSVSVTTCGTGCGTAGTVLSRQKFDAWGNVRSGSGAMPTDVAFTRQRENLEIGLHYFKARYYVPGLGRFLSADTVVPQPRNPQSLNRFSYTYNRPLIFTDPTGHCGYNGNPEQKAECIKILRGLADDYGLVFDDFASLELVIGKVSTIDGIRLWFTGEARDLRAALQNWQKSLGYNDDAEGRAAFASAIGLRGMHVSAVMSDRIGDKRFCDSGGTVGGCYTGKDIYFSESGSFAHELAHAWDKDLSSSFSSVFYDFIAPSGIYDTKSWLGEGWTAYARGELKPESGYKALAVAQPLPWEDLAETASNMVMHTSLAQQNMDSPRFAFVLLMLPGLNHEYGGR